MAGWVFSPRRMRVLQVLKSSLFGSRVLESHRHGRKSSPTLELKLRFPSYQKFTARPPHRKRKPTTSQDWSTDSGGKRKQSPEYKRGRGSDHAVVARIVWQ